MHTWMNARKGAMPVPRPDMTTGWVGCGGRHMTEGLTSTVTLDPGRRSTR